MYENSEADETSFQRQKKHLGDHFSRINLGNILKSMFPVNMSVFSLC